MQVRYSITFIAFVNDDGEDRTRFVRAEQLAMASKRLMDVVAVLSGLPISTVEIIGQEVIPDASDKHPLS